ncbi:MAG: helix-hairpin-helix domain-containing protein, partial [Dehalococcoidales bacterium]|nr:helix-hairpin-helix domain-containing protein [Dehalococcoidales bacterium]
DKDKKRPVCPVCGAEVFKPEGEVMYYCSNAACPAQVQARLELFTSRGAMDIRGIGESMSALLLREGLVKDVADLYYLKEEDLLRLERMGEKSAGNIIKAIENSRNRPLARVIYALGIRHVGGQMAQILADHFNSIDELANASEEQLMTIPTVGPKIAESIVAFFRQKENRRLIEKLRKAGVRLAEARPVEAKALPLAGQEFVITGRLDAFSREEAEARIKALGGITKDNVTRQTTYLVVGADPGSKLARAQALGIKQLTEPELRRFLEEKGG